MDTKIRTSYNYITKRVLKYRGNFWLVFWTGQDIGQLKWKQK